MQVSFGKTVYVAGIGNEMLDALEKYSGMNPSMTGDGLVMFEYDELEAGINDLETDDGLEPVEKFLIEALRNIKALEPNTGILGDIVFAS